MIIEVRIPTDDDPGYMSRAIQGIEFMEKYGTMTEKTAVTKAYLLDLLEFLAPNVFVTNDDGTAGDPVEALKMMNRKDFADVFNRVVASSGTPLVSESDAGSSDGQPENLESPPAG